MKTIFLLGAFLFTFNLFSQKIAFDFKQYNAEVVTTNLDESVISFLSFGNLDKFWQHNLFFSKYLKNQWETEKIDLSKLGGTNCCAVRSIFVPEHSNFLLLSLAK